MTKKKLSGGAVLLDFKTHLQLLGNYFGSEEFNSWSASAFLLTQAPKESLLFPAWSRRVRPKLESNGLSELCKMRLLHRRRVKREIVSKKGGRCFGGYQYLYKLSRQGWRYLEYSTNPGEQTARDTKNFRDLLTWAMVEKNAPPEKRDLDQEIVRFVRRSRGPGSRRFPNRADRLLAAYTKYLREMKARRQERTASSTEFAVTGEISNLRRELAKATKKIGIFTDIYQVLLRLLLMQQTQSQAPDFILLPRPSYETTMKEVEDFHAQLVQEFDRSQADG